MQTQAPPAPQPPTCHRSSRLEIIHKTFYRYSNDVSVSHHLARLTPRDLPHQRCLEHALDVEPAPALTAGHEDHFGNSATFFSIEGKHRTLAVASRSRVELKPFEVLAPSETVPWETARDSLSGQSPALAPEVCEFLFPSPLVPRRPMLADYAAPSFSAGRPVLDAVVDLTHRIHSDFKFDPRATTVATPLEQVIKTRRGVCQDFAQFEIGCLRALGLPARYVSGYLETKPPPGKPKLAGADASHAWVQVFIPHAGWIDVDPTNDLLPSERHVLLAWGRDFDDVSPIRGVVVGGGKHELTVAVDVIPLPDQTLSS